MNPATLAKPTPQLELLADGEGPTAAQLEVMPRAGELTEFQPFLKVLEENETRALAMNISADMAPEDRKKLAAEARRLRLDCFKVARLQAEKCKTALKANVLAFGKKVDAANGDIWDRCKSAESHLEAIENFEAIERLRIEDETRKVRASELNPFLTGACPVDLGKISAEEYASLLTDAKDLHELRVKRDQEARELAEKQALEAEEKRRAEEEQRQKEFEEAKAKQIEAEKELQRVEEARRVEREAAEKAARVEREKAAAAPDAEKLRAYGSALQAVPHPALSNVSVRTEVVAAVATALTAIKRQIAALEGGAV